MTAHSIGDLISGKRSKPARSIDPQTGQPVKIWANSYHEGQLEHRVWYPVWDGTTRGARRWTAEAIRRAREFERRSRAERRQIKPRVRNGALGEVGLRVYEALCELVDFRTGRLEPSVSYIAERIGHSYSAVHAALNRLRDNGFLHWIRRSRPTNSDVGPQVEQITNAYRLDLPKPARVVVEAILGEGMRGRAFATWNTALETVMAWAVFPGSRRGSGELAAAISRIKLTLAERESSTARESRPDIHQEI